MAVDQACPARDHEQAPGEVAGARVVLCLGAMVTVQGILDGQGVQLVLLRQGADGAAVLQALDMDPADLGPARAVHGEEGGDVRDLLDLKLLQAVIGADDPGGGLVGCLDKLMIFDPRGGPGGGVTHLGHRRGPLQRAPM